MLREEEAGKRRQALQGESRSRLKQQHHKIEEANSRETDFLERRLSTVSAELGIYGHVQDSGWHAKQQPLALQFAHMGCRMASQLKRLLEFVSG